MGRLHVSLTSRLSTKGSPRKKFLKMGRRTKKFEKPWARCTRQRPVRFFGARMDLILWCSVFFGCVWYGLRSSRTCFYIDASDSLLRVQERAVLVDNRQTHRTRRMPCAYSLNRKKTKCWRWYETNRRVLWLVCSAESYGRTSFVQNRVSRMIS